MDKVHQLVNDFDNLFKEADRLDRACRYLKDKAEIENRLEMLDKIDGFRAKQNIADAKAFHGILNELMEIVEKG